MSIISSKAPNPEKGRRYLASLDQALCNGSWSEVSELARKTDKHAPERKCTASTTMYMRACAECSTCQVLRSQLGQRPR